MTMKVITARPDSTLRQVVELMYRNKIGAVPIVDESGRSVGIVTKRDVIRYVINNVNFDERVELHMTKNPITVTPDVSSVEALNIMRAHNIGHLPVVNEERRVIGILSTMDFFIIGEL